MGQEKETGLQRLGQGCGCGCFSRSTPNPPFPAGFCYGKETCSDADVLEDPGGVIFRWSYYQLDVDAWGAEQVSLKNYRPRDNGTLLSVTNGGQISVFRSALDPLVLYGATHGKNRIECLKATKSCFILPSGFLRINA